MASKLAHSRTGPLPSVLLRLVIPVVLLFWVGPTTAADPAGDDYLAGTAVRVITPDGPLWMAGYASRNKPAEGKAHDLHAKALAVADRDGHRLVLLTTDLLGLPRSLSESVAEEIHRKTGIARECLMLTASHTHCGPVIRESMVDMYPLPPEEVARLGPYRETLRKKLVEVILEALGKMEPARLAIGQGTARFAMNRRQMTEKGVINGRNPEGPVDHTVPVLRVTSPKGELRAVVFGYACHNTTLQFYQWCGDYAGFAQAELESKHPGALALYWIGCGGDANPLPRGSVELCKKYGTELAEAVDGVLKGATEPARGPLRAAYESIPLAFDSLPDRARWQADLLSKQHAVKKRAERFLAQLDSGKKVDAEYPHYPVQVWQVGDTLTWVSLGGEVVVDYLLRIRRERLKTDVVWVTGYSNDVMAYIPSERVLKEGGYEADSSMIYYGMPTRWAPGLEDRIIATVNRLADRLAGDRKPGMN